MIRHLELKAYGKINLCLLYTSIEEHDEKTSDNDGCVYGAAQRMHGEYDCKTDF